jgi:hypothetical protein
MAEAGSAGGVSVMSMAFPWAAASSFCLTETQMLKHYLTKLMVIEQMTALLTANLSIMCWIRRPIMKKNCHG